MNPLKMPFSLVFFLFQVPQKFYSTSSRSYKVSYKWGIKMQFRESLCHFFPLYDIPPQHCCCTCTILLPAGMFRARVQNHQASKPNPHPGAYPRKGFFFPAFFPAKTSQGYMDGTGTWRGHTMVPTIPVLSTGTPTPMHQCPVHRV